MMNLLQSHNDLIHTHMKNKHLRFLLYDKRLIDLFGWGESGRKKGLNTELGNLCVALKLNCVWDYLCY